MIAEFIPGPKRQPLKKIDADAPALLNLLQRWRHEAGQAGRAFLGWPRGEKRHCSMAAIPTLEEEDARRPNREHETLVGEQTRLINHVKAILVRFGIRSI